MRLLLIHSDHIEYEARKQTPYAETGTTLRDSLDEVLVAFCAVEATDEQDTPTVIQRAVTEIRETAEKLGVDRIML
ncbi:MAG: threonyl-tRNA synthetase editing domain-containing protein, partial [Methanomicrobiales archaeon]|nr:threonyl-tRNA synthetase editing domain-containing protein [Methanomicrobiales archaeon]